jgi:phosphatidylinositol alpha-1,6-mannosyltransferase
VTGRPGLGVISFAQNAGGVAYVGRLLHRALRDAGSDPWTIELGVERRDAASVTTRARFAFGLLCAGLLQRADWMLFNHIAVARAHRAIPQLLRVPYGVFVHDVEAWASDLDAPRRATLRDAEVLIANSQYTARRVAAAHGDRVNVVACQLGLFDDDSVHGDVDQEILGACGARAVLIVGRITSDERYKGHDELVEAWPGVVAAAPDAQLFVAGWGDDVPRLQSKAVRLGVGDAVRFCGYVNEATLAALFRRVAIYAMPSTREGFGLVYLEAMRAGVPCIGSTVDAAAEVIVHGKTGFVVDRNDSRALTNALVTLLTDPVLRAAMGIAGRRRFETHFTYTHFRSRLLPILRASFPGTIIDSINDF